MSKGYSEAYPVHSQNSANLTGRAAHYASPYSETSGIDLSGYTHAEKIALFNEILNRKIHGISYSPYIDGQSPGTEISAQQIKQRMEIIKPYTSWIRSFSCIEGNQQTPRIAHELGLKTMVGIGLGEDREINETEMQNGINIAQAGHADIVAVGNEVLLRGDLSEDEMIDYIERVKQAVPDVPVGYVDAYFLFENHPRVTEACDVILINCYPFWESCPAEHALVYMKQMYRRAVNVANGKKVIISETGWPNIGSPYGGAVPSEENALNYFIQTYQWADEEGVDIFYFSSFDESWKVGDEGDVGAYWGLWDQHGHLKYE